MCWVSVVTDRSRAQGCWDWWLFCLDNVICTSWVEGEVRKRSSVTLLCATMERLEDGKKEEQYKQGGKTLRNSGLESDIASKVAAEAQPCSMAKHPNVRKRRLQVEMLSLQSKSSDFCAPLGVKRRGSMDKREGGEKGGKIYGKIRYEEGALHSKGYWSQGLPKKRTMPHVLVTFDSVRVCARRQMPNCRKSKRKGRKIKVVPSWRETPIIYGRPDCLTGHVCA
ncbi:uncharacterized protein EI90DRAFT_3296118 [Cantharellus anzutake]|uniref:uncharacterized protein n=1 Tax=Cantharellus anzutake TaxID=1750568 RepID=UPI001902C566|nr:uncharacterized protein EI90DRAFT_3296118 [Cantharellus anzutake]KAF8310245.1 hypothetical protein EI90DRAFT_3296118 [Cantharellus anzutake]